MDNKRLTIGILAHVDSGKTTLSEAMLYKTGEIKTMGRVDHGDSFLDGYEIERNRGITVFSKQAVMEWNDVYVTLMDTPGHVDFSAEMERTLSVLDYAILVISGNDGVQAHTETLWKLLDYYKIPAFIFVNKMDIAVHTRAELMSSIIASLGRGFVDFTDCGSESFLDSISMCSETLTEMVLDAGTVSDDSITAAIKARQVFPCYFGAALKLAGIDELLSGLERFTEAPSPEDRFGARVFKIARDENNIRLTFVKVTGGSLRVRETFGDEKVNQIRIYSGMKYQTVDEACQGVVCALTGLAGTLSGDGLGFEEKSGEKILEPFMTYSFVVPEGINTLEAFRQMKILSEEDPGLNVRWNDRTSEINVQMMGEIQLEILKTIIKDRFGYDAEFDQGQILYKETINDIVEGVGHFEPLRHYAEVHLILEPGERGSGLTFATACSGDELERNWQRLILSHLDEREHKGVLTGNPITDMKITLASGRASRKHTEGGDFRQATYRAVRQGLMKAESLLLEPYFDFQITVPSENVGRVMSDIQKMYGSFKEPEIIDEMSVLTGRGPVSELKDYQNQISSYTRGRGRIVCSLSGYDKCHDQDDVIKTFGYEAERDVENTADSVFCDNGTGDLVKWDMVEEFMHLPCTLEYEDPFRDDDFAAERARAYSEKMVSDRELMDIFEKTYGPVRQRTTPRSISKAADNSRMVRRKKTPEPSGPLYLLIDGYNLIHAWDELDELARSDFAIARERLIDILCNYRGFTQYEVIVVFDAYKVSGGTGSSEKVRNINVVYTKEAETADMYIERATHEMAGKRRVRVVTSDGMEQLIIMGHGALRTSSREFIEEVQHIEAAIYEAIR